MHQATPTSTSHKLMRPRQRTNLLLLIIRTGMAVALFALAAWILYDLPFASGPLLIGAALYLGLSAVSEFDGCSIELDDGSQR